MPEKSIAVLPFENLSDENQNEYFADGVQDEILTRLAKMADLKVISRTSTQRFKSTPVNLPEIAKQLGVANILEGSVQRSADQVRVNVQLINALTEAHLWAETYDRKLTDIFVVESDIAKTIAETLQAKLTGSEKQMVASHSTTDMTAYDLYHKGRWHWEQRSGVNIPESNCSLPAGDRARSELCAGLRWSGPVLCSTSFLYRRASERCYVESERGRTQSAES